MNKLAKIVLSVLVGTFLICNYSHAAPKTVVKTLSKRQSIIWKSSKCSLSVRRQSFKSITIQCKSPATNGTIRNAVKLVRGQTGITKAKSCFLAVKSKSAKHIRISCLTTQPTSTPTVTPTITLTATATSTPTITPTNTPTLTPNAQAATDSNEIVSFNSTSPNDSASVTSLTGVTAGQTIVAIDRRPNNGMLYGLGYNGTTGAVQLYLISASNGVASAVGSTGSFVDSLGDPVRVGTDANTKIGIDFNPVTDRLRVVTNNSQNFRINPNTGSFVDGDAGVSGVNMDGAINTGTTTVGAIAHTNNSFVESLTTGYTIDSSTDSLYIQNPLNSGTQTSGLGLTFGGNALDIIEARGFDIPSGVNVASSGNPVSSGNGFAILEFATDSQQKFSTIDLTTGAVSSVSQINSGADSYLGLALQSASSRPMYGLTTDNRFVKFSSATPGTASFVNITGLTSGEILVGIDYRPSTGALYGLGINSTTNTGTLYIIDLLTAAATSVGSATGVAFVDGSSNAIDFPNTSFGYGVDINPVTNQLRVVVETGLNFRVNLSTGAPIDGQSGQSGTNPDSDQNGAVTTSIAATHTNSYAGATSTSLYTLSASTDKLYIMSDPNSGTLTEVASITSSGSPLNFDFLGAFNAPSNVEVTTSGSQVTSGSAFAVLSSGGTTSLYSINLTNGVATSLGAIADGSTTLLGIAVGEELAR
jgi:hypothetical protein